MADNEAIMVELEHIKEAIKELKESFHTLLAREESRLSRMNEVELSVLMMQKDESTCKADNKRNFDAVHEKIRRVSDDFNQKIEDIQEDIETLKTAGKKARSSLADWLELIIKIGKVLGWLGVAAVGAVLALQKMGVIK